MRNISKDLIVYNMTKNGLIGKVCDLSVSYETIDVSYIEDIHKYLMKKVQYYLGLGFI